MKIKSIKIEKQYRSFTIDRSAINQESRTVVLSFSSETPVERWFGNEILSHDSGAVRLDRLNTGGPVLLDHETRDQIGVVQNAVIGADRKGRAEVRFGRSAQADEVFQDILDGIRSNVSVGYQIHAMTLVEEKDGVATYRATDWEPLEISIVPIPADVSVGVGRSKEAEKEIKITERKVLKMKCTRCQRDLNEGESCGCDSRSHTAPIVNLDEVRSKARKEEMVRVNEILAIGELYKYQELARQFVTEGRSIEEMKSAVLERIGKSRPIPAPDDPNIGMSDKDIRQFSIVRAINALAERDWRMAPFEKECSDAVAKKHNRKAQGFFIPPDVQTRDLTKGSFSGGGATVDTMLMVGSFIDMLRNNMMVRQMGATILSGLVGDIAIPRQTGGATAYWVDEGVAPTESQQAVGQIGMTPKTVGAMTDISRKLLMQSSIDVEGFVRQDLAQALGLAIDQAAINGLGSAGQPLGIINTTGIGSVAGGTNGAAPSWANLVDLESAVANANAAVGSLGYLTNTKVKGKLKQTFTNATYGEIPIWGDGSNGIGVLNGLKAGVSNQIPSNLSKGSSTGVCSAIIFGNWADLIIAEWGTLDILVDPYTGGGAGTLRIRILQDVDMAVRHVESFAAMLDALTA